jgi:hypothetical protein
LKSFMPASTVRMPGGHVVRTLALQLRPGMTVKVPFVLQSVHSRSLVAVQVLVCSAPAGHGLQRVQLAAPVDSAKKSAGQAAQAVSAEAVDGVWT